MFQGVLTVRDRCEVCGLNLIEQDTGDGPAALIIILLGALVVGMAFWVEFHFSPPLWVHAVLWPIVTVPLALLLMRPMKAGFIAVQYRHMSTDA